MNWAEGQFILIDKPREWTSFDVVKKIRNHLKVKIGHAGTLDPLATGLLILATGKNTKKIDEVQAKDKVYEGVIEIGKTTPSYDLETDFDAEQNPDHLTEADVLEAITKFTGEIEQFPPIHSAVKVDGVRAYKKARRNEAIKTRPRQVSIHSFKVTKFENPEIHFEIHCSKGTYIRSIANDIGQELGVGGYLKSLRRTAIGDFNIDAAHQLEDFLNLHPRNEDH